MKHISQVIQRTIMFSVVQQMHPQLRPMRNICVLGDGYQLIRSLSGGVVPAGISIILWFLCCIWKVLKSYIPYDSSLFNKQYFRIKHSTEWVLLCSCTALLLCSFTALLLCSCTALLLCSCTALLLSSCTAFILCSRTAFLL